MCDSNPHFNAVIGALNYAEGVRHYVCVCVRTYVCQTSWGIYKQVRETPSVSCLTPQTADELTGIQKQHSIINQTSPSALTAHRHHKQWDRDDVFKILDLGGI